MNSSKTASKWFRIFFPTFICAHVRKLLQVFVNFNLILIDDLIGLVYKAEIDCGRPKNFWNGYVLGEETTLGSTLFFR